jgi:hypothetical protein
MYATLPLIMTRPKSHGGHRKGAGRKSIFGVKAVAKPFAMDFTPGGRRRLQVLCRRHKLSRNAVLGTLALQFADRLTFDVPQPFPNKAQAVLSIRVPRAAAAQLNAARKRTKHSYSDLGEALVQWFGDLATYPAPTAKHKTP